MDFETKHQKMEISEIYEREIDLYAPSSLFIIHTYNIHRTIKF